MQNDTTTIAPINTLPPEILAHVFALSRSHCARIGKGNVKFHDLAVVCAYWRLVALDTTELWSHIDVGPKTPNGLTQLLLGRTRNVPIDVHAYEPGPPPDYEPTTGQEVTSTVDTLAPHIHRVRALHVESYGFYPQFTAAVANLWLDHVGVCLPKSLVINIPHISPPLVPHALGAESFISGSENAKGVLCLLGTLHLENIDFGWNSGAYRGLVDLRLIFRTRYASIHTSEFAEILSESPALAVLKLESLVVRREEGRSQPTPISMKYLSVLNLVNMRSSSLKLLLPLISLRDSLTETSAAISVSRRIHRELEELLFHSRITTLYYSHRDTSPSLWSSLLHSFHLRTLIMALANECGASVGGAKPPHFQQQPSSRPPRVIMVHCDVSFKGLNNLIASHGIRELDLEECDVPSRSRHDLHDIRNLLLDRYPELQCNVSDTDSTRRLPCRMLFDDYD